MANRSTQHPPARAWRTTRKLPPGDGVRSIGPSDSSDMAAPGLLDGDLTGLDRATSAWGS
jgi:hypothetical protein